MSIQVFKPLIRQEAIDAVSETLKSGWIGQGPKVKQFEQEFRNYLQTESHTIAVTSATAALHLALRLLNISPGDEVITTSLTFVSTNHVIKYEGASPIFADIDLSTGNLSSESIESQITDKTKAIIVVHYSGYPCDMERINKLSDKYGIPVIEDCAHACGAIYANGLKVGNTKNICCFSFQAVKNLPVGDGGMLVVPTEEMNTRANHLRWLGIDKDTHSRTSTTGEYLWKYDVPELGYKYNMNDINATIGVEQLKYLDADNERREEIATMYRQELGDTVKFLDRSNGKSSYHFEPILVDRRDDLIKHLRANNIHPGVHYRRNDKYDVYQTCNLPNTECFENRVLTLPIHLHLTDEEISHVTETIKRGW